MKRLIADCGVPSGSSQIMTISCFLQFRYQWSRIPFSPPPPHFSEYLLPILPHFYDQIARNSRLLVSRPPNQQFQQCRRQINPLLRQPVIHSSPVGNFRFCCNNPPGFQLPQTICQDICSDTFPGSLKLLKCPEAANHQITNDEQRPPISKPLEGDTHRTARPSFCIGFPRQLRQTIKITCEMQVIAGQPALMLQQALCGAGETRILPPERGCRER